MEKREKGKALFPVKKEKASSPVKVTHIITQTVSTDKEHFKSVVQSLTGKGSKEPRIDSNLNRPEINPNVPNTNPNPSSSSVVRDFKERDERREMKIEEVNADHDMSLDEFMKQWWSS